MLNQVQHDVCMNLQHTRHSTLVEFTLPQRYRGLNGAAYSQITSIKQEISA
jgi:hypothetical protein